MAYVTIPKDLTKVKSKVLFGLTKRQLICFGAAALIGVPLFLDVYKRQGYSKALENQEKGHIKIRNHAKVLSGDLHYDHKGRER